MTRPTEGPFSVPAGTTLRFGSLVLLAASVTAYWYMVLGDIWRPADNALPDARCQVRTGYYTAMGPWLSPDEQARYAQFRRCMASVTPNSVLWVATALAVLALMSLLLFALQPVWHRRRRRLVPIEALPAPDTAALREELRALVRTAGLARVPRFLVEPANPRPAGRAFGGLGRRRVALSAGLVVQLRYAPEKFRAVVLHELAHIRNGDVTVTYVTLAVWRAFVLVTVVPVLAQLVDPLLVTTQPLRNPYRAGPALVIGQLATLGWFFLVLTALVYVARTAVLRAREAYADARAAQWLDPGVLREILTAPAARDGTRWWHTHPRLSVRARLLDVPELLLRPGFWESFTAGFAVQIANVYAYLAAGSLWTAQPGSLADQGAEDAATLVTALVLVVAAWRGAAFVRSGGGGRAAFTRAGLGLGLGLASAYGLYMLRDGLMLHGSDGMAGRAFTLAGMGRDLVLVVLMLAVVLVLSHWAGHSVQVLGPASRRPRALLAAVALLAASWACLRWWNTSNYGLPPLADTLAGDASVWRHSVLQAHGSGLDLAVVTGILWPFVLLWAIGPVTVFAAPLLWLVPLQLGAARREAVRSAARIGAVAASAWLLVDVGLRARAHFTVPSGIRTGDGFAVVFVCWEIAAVLVVQFGAAVVLGARRMRLMPSLFATTLTGLLSCLALWALHLTGSCLPGLQISAAGCPSPGDVFVAFDALRDVGVLGSILTAAGVLLGRALQRRSVPRRPPGRLLPGRVARLALVALAGVFIALAAWPAPKHERVESVGVDYVPPRIDPAAVARESYPIWIQGGGVTQALDLSTALADLSRAVEPLWRRGVGWAAISRDAQVRAACRNLGATVGRVEAFPAPPGRDTAAHWKAYLQVVRDSAGNCAEATGSVDFATETADMMRSMEVPPQPADAVSADLGAAVERSG